ncbi:MAG TPA: hypothetical protein VFB14_04580 [Bryobacteraceae bacterium]|jgi:hypothetical protein|nr:hypothetical protein [Bryobacteraceae bacterium]
MLQSGGNPLGFGASDFLLFFLAGLFLLFAVLWKPALQTRIARFADKTGWCMLLLAALPVALRLLLLPHHPVPTPDVYDEFSHLLVADTLLHFRLGNPPHPLHQFFETFFVLQEPTYSSIYPIGQGLTLAFGRLISGLAWTGVVLCIAAFCALCYWMLRTWTTPAWALLGGMLAVIEFGPLNLWMNCYWGGALGATAGCLVFGSLPRLERAWKRRYAVLLGAGFAIHMLTRPFESTLLLASIVLFFVPVLRHREKWRLLARSAGFAMLAITPAIVLTLLQNKEVTHHWTTLPYALSQYQYGVPATLTFQKNALPHVPLTPQQALDYKAQSSMHGDPDTPERFLLRLIYRIRYYRFFFLPPLYAALVAFLFAFRQRHFLWIVGTLAIFALGTNLFPYLLVHYLSGVTCLFVLVSAVGLKQLARLTIRNAPAGQEAVRILVLLCFAHFVFWYGLHLFENAPFSFAMMRYETWDAINHGNPAERIAVNKQLAAIPGKLLVFVRYWPNHIFQNEWVWNAADIDRSRIVWARDLGTSENEKLLRYYPDRKPFLLEPDARPAILSPLK